MVLHPGTEQAKRPLGLEDGDAADEVAGNAVVGLGPPSSLGMLGYVCEVGIFRIFDMSAIVGPP